MLEKRPRQFLQYILIWWEYLSTIFSDQLKEERKKLRLKKTEKPVVVEEEEKKEAASSTTEDSILAIEDGEGGKDKSFDNISSLTSDVTTKVGSVGQSVKSGVQVTI